MGGCIKLCFGFVFFSVFKSVPNSSQKPLLSSPWSLLENIFVQAFEKSGSFQSYNKVLCFFFFLQHRFPLPYLAILLFLLCRNTLFCNSRSVMLSRQTHGAVTPGQLMLLMLHWEQKGFEQSIPPRWGQSQSSRHCCSSSLQPHEQRGGGSLTTGDGSTQGLVWDPTKEAPRGNCSQMDAAYSRKYLTGCALRTTEAMCKSLCSSWRAFSCFKTASST